MCGSNEEEKKKTSVILHSRYSVFVNYVPVGFYYNNVAELFTASYSIAADDPKRRQKGQRKAMVYCPILLTLSCSHFQVKLLRSVSTTSRVLNTEETTKNSNDNNRVLFLFFPECQFLLLQREFTA
jgi:hypothetical protein